MKRVLFALLLVVIFLLSVPPKPADASCRKITSDADKKDCAYVTQFSLPQEEVNQCNPQDIARIGTVANQPYDLCCDEISDTNAFFSLKAPLCGSSDERGSNNATCWTCGGDLRCTGAQPAFALKYEDGTAGFIKDPSIRQPVNPGDTNVDQIWRIPGANIPAEGFDYNGLHYDKPPGDLIVCSADTRACGAAASDNCTGRFAQASPTPIPEAPIVVKGDTNFANPSVGKTLYSLLGIVKSFPPVAKFVLEIAGQVWPDENLLKNPSLEKNAVAIFNATSTQLKPLSHQRITENAKNCQRVQVTGRICAYDQGGQLQVETISKDKFSSKDCNPMAGNELRQGIQQLSSITTVHRQYDQNYEKPRLDIKIDEPLKCWEIDEASPVLIDDRNSQKKHIFGGVFGEVIGEIVSQIIALLRFPFDTSNFSKEDVEGGFLLRTTMSIIDRMTGLWPWSSWGYCYGPGCEPRDISRVQYPQPEDRFQPVASLQTYKPYSHDYPGSVHGGDEKQPFRMALSDNVDRVQTAFSYANKLEKSTNYALCLGTPLALQKRSEFFPNEECKQNWKRKVSKQHGAYPVPERISSLIDGLKPRPVGILGMEYLRKYSETLITTRLTDRQLELLMARIQELINTYVTSGQWPNAQLADPQRQKEIHDFAQTRGLNEAFLYALWLEETHASSVGDYPFGCDGYTTDQFAESLRCVAEETKDPATGDLYIDDPLPEALCLYADGTRNCTFEAHPYFVRNLMYYYDYLTTSGSLTP